MSTNQRMALSALGSLVARRCGVGAVLSGVPAMKALSLTQPWATLIALGAKRIETRSWRTDYSGPLAIHASKAYPRWAKDMAKAEPFHSALHPNGNWSYPDLTLGVVVCVTSLLYCVPTSAVRDKISEQERAFGDYADGRWAWALGPVLIRYGMAEYPVKGHLGLWDWKGP